jgi:hypothetical protein
MNTLERRTYHSLGELLTDFRVMMSRRKDIRSLRQGDVISPSFRERN